MAGIVWWKAVSNTPTWGTLGISSVIASIPVMLAGLCRGRDIVALADFFFYCVVDKHAFAELLAAMYYAVTYSLDFVIRFDAAVGRIGKFGKDSLDSLQVIDKAEARR